MISILSIVLLMRSIVFLVLRTESLVLRRKDKGERNYITQPRSLVHGLMIELARWKSLELNGER